MGRYGLFEAAFRLFRRPGAGRTAAAAVVHLVEVSAEDLRVIRREYLERVEAIRIVAATMREDGASSEAIARRLSDLRNEAKRATRRLMDPGDVAKLERRNQEKYGDPIGPSPDFLYQRYRSWEKVIDASTRTDPVINRRLGLENE